MLALRPALLCYGALLTTALLGGCGSDAAPRGGDSNLEQTGSSCNAARDCYPDITVADLKGEVQCLDRVEGGYCTHLCKDDNDCCAVDGECETGHPQVCGPFESTGQMMCFLSCEKDQLGGLDEGEYCGRFAGNGFSCRSTGGGSANRKVCVPGGGGTTSTSCSLLSECGADFKNCCYDAPGGTRQCYSDGDAKGLDCL